MKNIRIGFGYDVHKFEVGRPLIIGGIEIPHKKGLAGHSDADVLIHAICDALLGAANLRDIGYHFSDTDAAYKNIDSKILLKQVIALLDKEGWILGNIDATIAAQQPKLSPHIEAMKQTISEVIGCNLNQISVKASTTERLGFEGREEGISTYCVALIHEKEE